MGSSTRLQVHDTFRKKRTCELAAGKVSCAAKESARRKHRKLCLTEVKVPTGCSLSGMLQRCSVSRNGSARIAVQ